MLSRDTDLPPKQRAKAERILAEALRLERVVSEFLTYARPERPQEARIDLAAALEESAESARGGLGWGGELVVAADRLRVHCDEDHLRQVLLNLLRNAMQACGGEGTVRARVSRKGSDVELSVEDSGSGIPEGDRLKVFEPFYSGSRFGSMTANWAARVFV
jgi:signal transduction histidine kinase